MLLKTAALISMLAMTLSSKPDRVAIIKISGEVKIRRGVDEHWQPAAGGTLLDDIDTILTGEAGKVQLRLHDGAKFELGPNSILDIADLRKISEREMFLLLMSRKINNIGPRENKTKLRIGNVHVTHGELKTTASGKGSVELDTWQLERNGATALYKQELTTNAIVKFNKILQKYPDANDCGELHFLLGTAFESIAKTGQAMSAYRMVETREGEGCDSKWGRKAEAAIRRLK